MSVEGARRLNLELHDLSARLQNLVSAELADGERVLWIGQPLARRMAQTGLPIVLFGIPWTAFALFWTAGAAGFQWPNFNRPFFAFFPLFGIPFILIGFGMLGSPLWLAAMARRTVYAVTDRRALLFEGGRSTRIRSFFPADLTDMYRNQRADGSGDLVFDTALTTGRKGGTGTKEVGFMAIPRVKEVEDLVRALVVNSAAEAK